MSDQILGGEHRGTVDLRGIRCLLFVEAGTVFDRQVMLGLSGDLES